MWEYVYNPEFWTVSTEPPALAIKSWYVTVIVAIIARGWRDEVRSHILIFAGFVILMEHASNHDPVTQLLQARGNSVWYHLGTPVLFLLLSRFYRAYLLDKTSQWALPAAFAGIAIINAIFINDPSEFPTVTIGLYSISGIVLSIAYFLYLLRALKIVYLEREPMVWVSVGFLIYFSANFLLWVAVTFINYDYDFFFSIYKINSFSTLFLNACLLIALLLPSVPEIEHRKPIPTRA